MKHLLPFRATTYLLAMCLLFGWSTSAVAQRELVASEDFDGGNTNLINGFNPVTDNLDGGPGDFFGVGSRNSWPQSAGVPFSIADDSTFPYSGGNVFEGDTEGIFGENSDLDNNYFAISDSDEFGDDQTATWVFDISGFEDLELSIDMGGIADGNQFGGFTTQTVLFTVSIDGGATSTAIELDGVLSDTSFHFRPMDIDSITNAVGVLQASGDNGVTKLLAEDGSADSTNYLDKTPPSGDGAGELDTYIAALAGTGNELTLTLTADFPFEAMAFDNIQISGIASSNAKEVIAAEDFDGNALNLISGFDPEFDNQDGGGGDFFGVGSRNAWPQSQGVPFSIADDSTFPYSGGNVFESDTEGIFGENSDLDNNYFAISDSDEFGDAQTATWTFDITGAENLCLSIDMGGIADGTQFGGYGPQTVLFSAAIDGQPADTAFYLASTIADTLEFQFRPMDFGTVTFATGVLEVSGKNTIVKLLAEDSSVAPLNYLNKTPSSGSGAGELDTYQTALDGSGNQLTVTLTTNFPFEAMAFDNIKVLGTPGEALPPELILTGVMDGTYPGGLPRVVELFAKTDIPDLSIYEIRNYNNGNTSITGAITLNGSASAGDYIYAVNERSTQDTLNAWFDVGVVTIVTSIDSSSQALQGMGAAIEVNGDDAFELFNSSTGKAVDLFGNIGEDGSGQPWEYRDGWAYRVNGTGPDSAAFTLGNWIFSGPDALDGAADNESASAPFPIATYTTDNVVLPDTLFIHEVQGSGLESPFIGQQVIIEGVVTGDYQGIDHLQGFYVQEEEDDYDNDSTTSEGIFVFEGSTPLEEVNIGDRVAVIGSVSENSPNKNGLTSLVAVTSIVVTHTDVALPSSIEVTLPTPELNYLERYEGMRTTFTQDLYGVDYFNYGRYNEARLSSDPFLQNPTNVEQPGSPEFMARNEFNLRNQINLDDDQDRRDVVQNRLDLKFTVDNDGTTAPSRGAIITGGIHGIISDENRNQETGLGFASYLLRPANPDEVFFTNNPERPTGPPEVGGELTVVAFNVLNYFTTFGSRGARNAEEFERQTQKIVAAIKQLDADILGLIELENNDESIPALIAAVNGPDGFNEEVYDFIQTGSLDRADGSRDAIKVGIIYKPSTVTPLGDFAALNNSFDANYFDTKNRPTLAQSFSDNLTQEVFTVAVSHLKSKGSDCADVGDPDTDDGQSSCNLTRLSAVRVFDNWMATNPTGVEDEDVLLIGDLNSYAREDPIQFLIDQGYINTAAVPDDTSRAAYSFVFGGPEGTLDYVLASESLREAITGAGIYHINADYANALGYPLFNQPFFFAPDEFRSSDHDPVLVGLNLFLVTSLVDEFNSSLKMYPNPAQTHVNIQLSSEFIGEIPYRVYDTNGRMYTEGVLDHRSQEMEYQFDVSNLVPGIFILEMNIGGNLSQQRLIKQ